jgi:MFS family permease
LLASYTVNQLGDLIGLVALAVLVYGQTGDPLATSALFIAAQFLPAFAAPALTARVDQAGLRRSLTVIYLIEALLFGSLAFLAEHFSLWLILTVTFVDGALMLTARGLTRAAVSSVLLPAGMLRQGNGLLNIGFALASVIGAGVGGVLVNNLGVTVALIADAVTFVLVALLLATTTSLPTASLEPERFWVRIRDGMRHVRTNTVVRALLGGEAAAVLLFSLIVPIEVIYAKETLHASDAGFGLLLAAWCAGIVVGSLAYIVLRSRSAVALILASTAAIGVSYLGMAAVSSLSLACAFAVLGGAGNGVQWVSVMTLLQERTPADLQARITGLLESVSSAATGLGFLLGGIAVAIWSPRTAYAIAGGGVLVLVALAGTWAVRGAGASTGVTGSTESPAFPLGHSVFQESPDPPAATTEAPGASPR